MTVSSMGELSHSYFWAFKLDVLEARLEKQVGRSLLCSELHCCYCKMNWG